MPSLQGGPAETLGKDDLSAILELIASCFEDPDADVRNVATSAPWLTHQQLELCIPHLMHLRQTNHSFSLLLLDMCWLEIFEAATA